MSQSEGPQPQQAPATPPAAPPSAKAVPSRRINAFWITIVGGSAFLIALLIFIFQNLENVRVTFLFFHGSVPLALSLLCSAIAGALIVVSLGVARMVQLRRAARRHRDAAAAATRSGTSP